MIGTISHRHGVKTAKSEKPGNLKGFCLVEEIIQKSALYHVVQRATNPTALPCASPVHARVAAKELRTNEVVRSFICVCELSQTSALSELLVSLYTTCAAGCG